eukprot:PhF_6_TR17604/c0_g1_i1/m.26754
MSDSLAFNRFVGKHIILVDFSTAGIFFKRADTRLNSTSPILSPTSDEFIFCFYDKETSGSLHVLMSKVVGYFVHGATSRVEIVNCGECGVDTLTALTDTIRSLHSVLPLHVAFSIVASPTASSSSQDTKTQFQNAVEESRKPRGDDGSSRDVVLIEPKLGTQKSLWMDELA